MNWWPFNQCRPFIGSSPPHEDERSENFTEVNKYNLDEESALNTTRGWNVASFRQKLKSWNLGICLSPSFFLPTPFLSLNIHILSMCDSVWLKKERFCFPLIGLPVSQSIIMAVCPKTILEDNPLNISVEIGKDQFCLLSLVVSTFPLPGLFIVFFWILLEPEHADPVKVIRWYSKRQILLRALGKWCTFLTEMY